MQVINNEVKNNVTRINTVEEEVKNILINCPQTRNNDELLYKNISDAIRKGLLSPRETISRCRRKIQKENEELKGNERARSKRKKLEQAFKEYAK